MLQPLVRRTWAPRGRTPILRQWSRHDRLSVISAITLAPHRCRIGLYWSIQRENICAADVVAFLRSLSHNIRRGMVLIMDRWSVPKAKTLWRSLGAHAEKVRVEWLPAYAPDLNPVEQVWNHSKYACLIGIPPLAVGGYLLNTEIHYYYVVFVALALVFLFTKNVVSSRVGRALVAIAENDVAASASGIHATQYKLQIFTLSAAYAGLAGALFAHYARYIGPNSFSLQFSFALMFMIMLGGRGNVWGGVLGAGLLTLLPEALRHAASLAVLPQTLRGTLTEFSYQLVLYGVLVFLFTIFLPEGLAGAIATVWRRLRPTPLGEWTAAPAESGAAGPRHAFLSQDSSALGIAQASPPDQSGKVSSG